jgi:hypothetical protein
MMRDSFKLLLLKYSDFNYKKTKTDDCQKFLLERRDIVSAMMISRAEPPLFIFKGKVIK